MNRRVASFFCCIRRDRGGAVAVLVGVLIIVLAAFSAIVVDLGYLFYAQRALQASADAAALAGAQNLNVGPGGTAIAMAIAYSGVSGGYNANANLTVTMASGYPQMKCLTTIGISCGGSDSANTIVVVEQTTVPLYFAQLLGINSWQISVTATASGTGSVPVPLDVMIVLDTTGSMAGPDTCRGGNTKIACALLGIQTLLGGNSNPYGLLPCSQTCGAATNGNVPNPIDRVGVMVYPGLTATSQAQREYDCSGSVPTFAAYKSSPVYSIIGLSSDYRLSATATTLTTDFQPLQGDSWRRHRLLSRCRHRAFQRSRFRRKEAYFFADAITAAQNALVANGRPSVQKVIILLSDGDANATLPSMTSSRK